VTIILLAFLSLLAPSSRPLIIAHRGASGYRPEHTLEAYGVAIEMGADFIEPDLVSTKDGVLIARHENEMSGTTDVADRFPDRKQTRVVDGRTIVGWFAEDFTLSEIKTMRARERLPYRSHAHDGQFQIPTFDEVIDLAQRESQRRGREVGVYPETKHPTYFRSVGLPLEDMVLASLDRYGWNSGGAPVFIQSFEAANLRDLRKTTSVRLIQLVSDPKLVGDAGLRDIASYADGIGPEKQLLVPILPDGSLGKATDVVDRAHAAGLLVHVWTIRKEKDFLPAAYAGHVEVEFDQFRRLGIDGAFTDFPDLAVAAYRSTHPGSRF
jgi:glycerophosphoryl diester phosphodiesterase